MKRKVYLAFILSFLLIFFALPRGTKFPYDYKVGHEWQYDALYAQFDFPIYKSTDKLWAQINEESSAKVTPYYKYSEQVSLNSLRELDGLDLDSLHSAVVSSVKAIFDRGVISDDESIESETVFVQRNKRAVKYPQSELYTAKSAKDKLLSDISAFSNGNADSLLRASGVYALLVPNVIFDPQTTQLVKAESDSELAITSDYIRSGELIISPSEFITSDLAVILDSYKKEYEANFDYTSKTFLLWLGNFFLAAMLVVFLFFRIKLSCPYLFDDKRVIYLLTIFTIFVLVTLIVFVFNDSRISVIPYTLMVLMLQAFFKPKEYIPVYIVALLPLLLFAQDGPAMFIMFAIAGIVIAFIFRFFRRGWRQFVAALITFVILSALFLSFKALNLASSDIGVTLLRLFIGSVLTVAVYPLIFLFEKIFDLVSDSRLTELCDTSAPIIRRLELKAPGTFQHSLQVMNMVDVVARAIDLSPDLLRAGALYHDIGKMNNPLCFVENEFMVSAEDVQKYHSELSPLQSAQDIIKHVSDGVDLAQKAHLPKVIIDFITTHHGTTSVKFFYNKFLAEGGSPKQMEEFMYKGEKPRTKAQVVLMLCDSVEAAARTLKANTPKAYSDFIESIVEGKMAQAQFDQADITINELNIIKETLKQYLAQLNHERIVYPKDKKR